MNVCYSMRSELYDQPQREGDIKPPAERNDDDRGDRGHGDRGYHSQDRGYDGSQAQQDWYQQQWQGVDPAAAWAQWQQYYQQMAAYHAGANVCCLRMRRGFPYGNG